MHENRIKMIDWELRFDQILSLFSLFPPSIFHQNHIIYLLIEETVPLKPERRNSVNIVYNLLLSNLFMYRNKCTHSEQNELFIRLFLNICCRYIMGALRNHQRILDKPK